MRQKRKAASSDFSPDKLPRGRREQFFDLLKHRHLLLFEIGLLCLLGLTPFLFVYGYNNLSLLPYAASTLSKEDYAAFNATNTLVFDLFYLACFLIFSLFLSGIARLLRNLCWGEGIFFWKDFWRGVKKNWLAYLIWALVFGACHLLNDFLSYVIPMRALSVLPSAFALLFFPIMESCMVASCIYKAEVGQNIRNALYILFKRPWDNLLFLLFPFGVALIDVSPYPLLNLILYVVTFLALFPLYFLSFYLWSLAGYDRYVNAVYFPAYYQKGLAGEFLPSEKEEK